MLGLVACSKAPEWELRFCTAGIPMPGGQAHSTSCAAVSKWPDAASCLLAMQSMGVSSVPLNAAQRYECHEVR